MSPVATATDLLRRLASGTGSGVPALSGGIASPAGGIDFSTLLERAKSGSLESGRELRVDDPGLELTGAQVSRLGRVADAAEASGALKVLALIDGKQVMIDITHGTVSRATSSGPHGLVTGVDAVAVVPAEAEPEWPILRPGAGAGARADNRSLQELLGAAGAALGRAV